jgi:hypothetical protein
LNRKPLLAGSLADSEAEDVYDFTSDPRKISLLIYVSVLTTSLALLHMSLKIEAVTRMTIIYILVM